MTGVVIAAIILLLFAGWTAQPLLQRRKRARDEFDHHLAEVIESKHAVYRSLLDLDFDHRMGKVSDADYAVLRRQHEDDAIAILNEIDRSASAAGIGDTLEHEIAEARSRLRSS